MHLLNLLRAMAGGGSVEKHFIYIICANRMASPATSARYSEQPTSGRSKEPFGQSTYLIRTVNRDLKYPLQYLLLAYSESELLFSTLKIE